MRVESDWVDLPDKEKMVVKKPKKSEEKKCRSCQHFYLYWPERNRGLCRDKDTLCGRDSHILLEEDGCNHFKKKA